MDKRQGYEGDVTHLYKLYENGIAYQSSLGLREDIPRNVDFYEGKQWPAPTENTKNLPRPVINIVKMICRSKKSAILSTPVRLIYKSYSGIDLDRFNSFAQYVMKDLEQDRLDKLAIDDGVKKGSYFYHYYWDKNATDSSGRREGGLRCELIDPLNIFFEDPTSEDEQGQGWILISSRRPLPKIEALADFDVDLSQLSGDDDGCTLLFTRYFRIGGEVFCERGTKTAIINKPFSISPRECENECFTDTNEDIFCSHRATLYPIVAGQYERRECSIYGISEIEGIIPNQKAINFNIAMSLLNAQQCAWGKFIALPNALKGQKITNSPGQVLIDYSGTGDGIKALPSGEISDTPMAISTSLTELTRTVCGASQVMTGESYNSNMSGAAIAYLQAQAYLPIEELKSSFWIAKRKQGLVIAQFLKLYYYERVYVKRVFDSNGSEREVFDSFSSQDYRDSVFDVSVESVGGVKASVSSDISLLDSCLRSGSISFETYIRAYPESAISNKSEILRQIELEKKSEAAMLRKELEKYKKTAPVAEN